ncbi:MAG TPA: efflux RND transporter periplasmic adaptor subunit [Methylophilaceae bacterium]|jgi:cobalt-zinc-cadmium efflux system membrane fusion protein
MKKLMNTSQILALLLIAALGLVGCKDKEDAKQEQLEAQKEVVDPNVVKVTPELQKEIKTATVASSEIRELLRIPGSIQVDEQRMARIGAPVTGRITEIDVVLGQDVKQGQTLASLNSTELAQNQLTYIRAMQQISLQSKAVDRAKLLFASDVISAAEVQRREAELSGAQADLNAAKSQLMILGMSKQAIDRLGQTSQVQSSTTVSARLGGTVIERKVNLGQVVQPAEELFVVADLSHVWAVAEVPEQQIDLIQKNEEVNIEIPALDNQQMTGRLIFVGDVVNPQTRTVTVRTDIDNSAHNIKPAMLVSMVVQSKSSPKTAIPEQSVIRENDKNYVFVQIAPNQYRLREVTLGIEYNGFIAVSSGVTEGEVIVSEGAFHLNNERKRKELE